MAAIVDGENGVGLDPDSFLRQISAPVLLIRAEPELALSFTDEDEATVKAAIPSAEIVVVEGAPHAVQLQKRDRFIEPTRDFLRRAAGRRTY